MRDSARFAIMIFSKCTKEVVRTLAHEGVCLTDDVCGTLGNAGRKAVMYYGERLNAWTHLIGTVLALAGTVWLLASSSGNV